MRNIEKNTQLEFIELDRETFWDMIDSRMLTSKAALYLFCLFNCNNDVEKTHRIKYQEAADLLGFKKSVIYEAANELEKAGFIKRSYTDPGFIIHKFSNNATEAEL